jgi:hypothetical protein
MTDKTTLIELAGRVEAATEPSFAIFEKAFFACNPGPSAFGCSGYHNEALETQNAAIKRFKKFVDAEAWLDAAMMLVPEGCEWTMGAGGKSPAIVTISAGGEIKDAVHGFAATPALALTAASLRAIEGME